MEISGKRFLLLLCCLLPTAPVYSQEKDEIQDLVFLGAQRPLLLRLRIQIDGKPFRTVYKAAWEDYVRHLFRYLDRNGDGTLSEAEAARLPAPPRLVGDVNVAFNFRVLDGNGDGRVTQAELRDYYQEYSGGAFQVDFVRSAPARRPGLDEALFAHLDTNHDGKLSAKELRAAPTLFRLDLDQDELLTPAELGAPPAPSVVPPSPFGIAPNTRPAPPPFLVVEPDADRAELLERIRQHYLSSNGEAPALEKLLDGPADLELRLRLGKRAPGQAALEMVTRGTKPRVQQGLLSLPVASSLIELRGNEGGPPVVPGSRDRYLGQFREAAGTRGHLSAEDARRHGFFPQLFPLLDRDGDGRLTEKELCVYLDDILTRQERLAGGVVVLRMTDEVRGLFGLLDRNRDGRLGLREVRGAADLLERLGRAEAGFLTSSHLPPAYQVALGLGRASFNRIPDGVQAPPGMPLLTLGGPRPGLIWFLKMDRNRDGDVSPREFLGTRAQFRRLDADGDGLIDLEEALRAESLFRKK